MASPTRTLTVNFVGRTKNLDKSFKRVAKGSSLMSDKLMRATRMAGVGFAALGGVAVATAAALKPMIDKAASMEESLSKNRVVFGESAAAVEAFAETSLHAFGVTERAALEATGVIGTLGSAMGMTAADSASMATTLVGLAGDMSSFNDATVEETLTAIQAGLRGEAEPLRRFGVLLDAATLKAKALEKGIIKNTKDALTPQAKALAAYEVILEQTAVQMGDFERTSDSATNQSKLLAGEWDKIQTEIGTALLPAFTSIVTHLNESVLPAVKQFWSDPSWYEGGKLAGKAAESGFVQGIAGLVRGPGPAEIDELPWYMSWKASSELAFLAAAVSSVNQFVQGVDEQMNSDPVQEALKAAFESAGAAAFDRPLDQRDKVPDFGAAGAMIPGPGFPAPKTVVPPAGAMAPGPGLPAPKTVLPPAGAMGPSPGTPGTPVVAPAGPMVPGPIAGPTDAEILAWLGTSGAQQMLGQGPPNIVINAPAVSGQEVVEALGKYVDGNGPLPPHWQQTVGQ